MPYSSYAYYEPPPYQYDGIDGSIIFILLLAVFVGALIWILSWESESDERRLIKDVDKTFDELRREATTFDRKEWVLAFDEAQRRINAKIATRFR